MQHSDLPGVRLGDEIRGGPIRLSVVNPATEEMVAAVAGANAHDAGQAADRAQRELPAWAALSAAERAAALRGAAAALRAEPDEGLARLVTQETGKRLAEAVAEVTFSAAFFDWFADAVETSTERELEVGARRFVVRRKPVGVVAAMATWNFPVSIPARKIGAALAAGCTTVFKPSELTPLSGLRLAELVEPHLPPGVLTTVAGPGQELAEALIDHPAVAAVTFTGSTRVGGLIAARCAQRFTRTVLELGGRAPFIVLEDGDVSAAVDTLLVAKYRNNGASCIAANNVFVHERIYGDFLDAFVARSDRLRLGDPLDEDTELGPLIGGDHVRRLDALLQDARERGARTWQKEEVPARGHFSAPAVVEATVQMPLWEEELFGPVTPIRSFSDPAAVVAEVNAWSYGLAGYVCSGDPARARSVAEELELGIIGINNGAPNSPEVPFGGFKSSGVGREGGFEGLEEFTEAQTLSISVR